MKSLMAENTAGLAQFVSEFTETMTATGRGVYLCALTRIDAGSS